MKVRGAFVVLAVVMAACSSSPRATGTAPPSSSPSGTPLASASASATAGVTSSISASSSAAPASPAALPPKAAPAVPPAAGTYTYSQSGEAKAGAFTLPADPSGTLEVEEPTNASGGRRQTQTRRLSSSQSREQTLLFTSKAILLEESISRFGTQSISCKTERPLVAIELPLRIGASWADEGDCAGGHVSFTGEVLRTERRIVDGTGVATFVVHHVIKFKSDDADQTTDLTSWLSPDYRITVRAVERSSGTVQGTAFSQRMTEDLQSLSPA